MRQLIMKNKTKILISAIICTVVIASIFLAQPVRYFMATTSMHPLPSEEIVQDIYSINNSFVNFYLLKSGDKYIAFDAGTDAKKSEQALNDFGINKNDVTAIFLTHTDSDHVAAIPLFPSAEIYMAQSNKEFIETKAGHDRSVAFVDMNKDYKTMTDGETMTVAGTEVKCIFTPGHTDGSASYVADGKYLFAGDTLRLDNGNVTLFNDVFNMNNEEQKQSIKKLSNLTGIGAVFTMHYGFTTAFKEAFSKWSDPQKKAEYKKITPQEAQTMMNGDVIILDVRTQAEFDAGHIPDAVLLPVDEIREKAESALPDKNKTILVYCRSGSRSATASKTLVDVGYMNVFDIGGIINWPGEISR